jgi:hypothetical protein
MLRGARHTSQEGVELVAKSGTIDAEQRQARCGGKQARSLERAPFATSCYEPFINSSADY